MRKRQPWIIVRTIAVILTAMWTRALVWGNTDLQWKNISIDGQKLTVHCMATDKEGHVWLGTGSGLYLQTDNAIRHIGNDDLSRCRVNAIIPQDDRLYLGTNAGLLVYSFSDQTLTQLNNSFGEIRALAWCGDSVRVGDLSTYSLLCDSRGDLYAGTYDGLKRWNKALSCFETCMPEHSNATSNFVNSLIESPDRQSILVGIHEVLYRYTPSTDTWTELPFKGAMSIKCLAATKDEVFIGCGDGLYVLKDETITPYRHDGNDPNSLADNVIWSICTDIEGFVYVGHGRGLSVAGDTELMHVIPLSDLLGKGESGEIHTILRDRQGSLWFGGTNGIIQLSIVNYQLSTIRHFLPNVMIRAIYEDYDGALWFATDDGLKRYQTTSNDIKPSQTGDFITYYITDADGAHEAAWVYSIAEDSTSIYIGSYLGGVHRIAKVRLTAEGGKIAADESYNTSNSPMPNDFVRQIKLDEKGQLLIRYYEYDNPLWPENEQLPQGYFCAYYDSISHSTLLGGTDEIVEIGNDTLSRLIKQYRQVHSPFRSWWAITLYVLFAILVIGNFIWFMYKKRHTVKTAQELQDALTHVKERLTKTQDFIVPESTAEKQLVLIVKTIDENSEDSELNVNSLSEKTGIGTKQLYRIIKREMNMSPVEYINSVRLNKAAKMLAEHKFSVSEVCYKTGFSTPSYFTKCFQEKFGCKPSEYEKTGQK